MAKQTIHVTKITKTKTKTKTIALKPKKKKNQVRCAGCGRFL